MATVLLVMSDEQHRGLLAGELRGRGLHVLSCGTAQEAQDLLVSISAQLLLAPVELAAALTRLLALPCLAVEPGGDVGALARTIRTRLDAAP